MQRNVVPSQYPTMTIMESPAFSYAGAIKREAPSPPEDEPMNPPEWAVKRERPSPESQPQEVEEELLPETSSSERNFNLTPPEGAGKAAGTSTSIAANDGEDERTSSSSSPSWITTPRSEGESPSPSSNLCKELVTSDYRSGSDVISGLIRLYDDKYTSVSFGPTLLKEIVMASILGVGLSAGASIQGYRLMIERVRRVAQGSDSFSRLPAPFQRMLLHRNADMMVMLQCAYFFKTNQQGGEQVSRKSISAI